MSAEASSIIQTPTHDPIYYSGLLAKLRDNPIDVRIDLSKIDPQQCGYHNLITAYKEGYDKVQRPLGLAEYKKLFTDFTHIHGFACAEQITHYIDTLKQQNFNDWQALEEWFYLERIKNHDPTLYTLSTRSFQNKTLEETSKQKTNNIPNLQTLYIDSSSYEPENTSLILKFIIPNLSKYTSLNIEFDPNASIEQILDYINQCTTMKFHVKPTLCFSGHNFGIVDNYPKLKSILVTLENTGLACYLNLSANNLQNLGKVILHELLDIIIDKTQVSHLSLNNNHLHDLGTDFFLEYFKKLLASKLEYYELHGNNIEKFPLPILEQLADIARTRKKRYLQLLDPNKPIDDKTWSEVEHIKFARIKMILGSSYDQKPLISFPITKEQRISLICECIDIYMECAKERHYYLECHLLAFWMSEPSLTYEDQLRIAKYWVSKKALPLDVAKILTPQDRLRLFLQVTYSNSVIEFNMHFLSRYGFFQAEGSAISPFLSPWKIIDDQGLDDEEDADLVGSLIASDILPALKQGCNITWPKKASFLPDASSFYDKSLEKLTTRSHDGKTSGFVLQQMTIWFTWTLCLLTDTNPKNFNCLGPILEELLSYPDPKMRFVLMNMIKTHILENEWGFHLYQKLSKEFITSNKKSFLRLPIVWLIVMANHEINQNSDLHNAEQKTNQEKKQREEEINRLKIQITSQIETILYSVSSRYIDGVYLKPFLTALQCLHKEKDFSLDQKLGLILNILRLQDKSGEDNSSEKKESADGESLEVTILQFSKARLNKQREFWLLVQGLSNLGDLQALFQTKDFSETSLKQLFNDCLRKHFHLSDEQFQYHTQAVSGRRNETALFTYLGNIHKLQDAETREKVKASFLQYVDGIYSDKQIHYTRLRETVEANPHLEAIFSERQQLRSLWFSSHAMGMSDFVKRYNVTPDKAPINYAKKIYEWIFLEHHADPGQFKNLRAYLEAQPVSKSNVAEQKRLEEDKALSRHSVKAQLERKITLKKSLIQTSHGVTLYSSSSDSQTIHYMECELAIINFLDTSSELNKADEQRKFLSIAKNAFQKAGGYHSEFMRNLKTLIRTIPNLNKRAVDYRQYTVIRGGNHWDRFMLGSDMPDSCQRVDGDIENCQYLTGFLNDPKNDFSGIQDPKQTVSRAIIRLLNVEIVLGEKDFSKPVIFLENVYPASADSMTRAVIQKNVEVLANAADLSVVGYENSSITREFRHPVKSLYSPASGEYVDFLYKGVDGGVFELNHCYLLYSPHEAKVKAMFYAKFISVFHKDKKEDTESTTIQAQSISPQEHSLATELTEHILQFFGDDVGYDMGTNVKPQLYFSWKKQDHSKTQAENSLSTNAHGQAKPAMSKKKAKALQKKQDKLNRQKQNSEEPKRDETVFYYHV